MSFRAFRIWTAAAACVVVVGCADQPTEPKVTSTSPLASLVTPSDRTGEIIPDQYIVLLRKEVLDAPGVSRALAQLNGGQMLYSYNRVVKGFAVRMSAKAAEALEKHPHVLMVEQNRVVSTIATQTNATWGLDRVDQRNLPLNSTYSYTPTGAGVRAYIIDTGIRTSHSEFGGRASVGFDALGGNGQDCNGHGTHVAGTVAGAVYGVAKGATPIAVRVLDCTGNGSTAGVIAGVDWVTSNHIKPAVANMSLGGSMSSTLDNAVRNSIAAGVTYAIAAGNSNTNACNSSPARVAEAITVGATNSTDGRAYFSNYGFCLDIFAPGENISSAWSTGDAATAMISGTSMASPHVAGAIALYLESNPTALPAAVTNAVLTTATTGKVISAGFGSPNRLLYALFSGAPAPPPPPPTGAPCTNCEKYSGTLSGTGALAYQPNGNYFYSGVSGTHSGWLQAGTGTDFDLFLQKWNGAYWQTVAASYVAGSTETINYNGTPGYYIWRIESHSGSGAYDFWMRRP